MRNRQSRGLTTGQRLRLDRFLSTPASSFSRTETLFFLEMVALTRDFVELYWSDADAMKAYVQAMDRAPFAPEVCVTLLRDYFASGPREIPDYDGIPVQILYSEADRVTPWERHEPSRRVRYPMHRCRRSRAARTSFTFRSPAHRRQYRKCPLTLLMVEAVR